MPVSKNQLMDILTDKWSKFSVYEVKFLFLERSAITINKIKVWNWSNFCYPHYIPLLLLLYVLKPSVSIESIGYPANGNQFWMTNVRYWINLSNWIEYNLILDQVSDYMTDAFIKSLIGSDCPILHWIRMIKSIIVCGT